MKKFLAFAAASCVFCAVSFSQNSFFDNYVYQSWNSFGGLTGTTATGLAQTKDGFINIGTYEGLVRFDGLSFTTWRRGKENELKKILEEIGNADV